MMPSEKKFLPAFHVFISKDLSKEAFIHWTDFEGKRHRRKGGINKRHTIAGRKAAALTLLAELEKSFLEDMRYVPMQERLHIWLRARRGRIRLKSYQTFQSIIEGFLSWIGSNIITSDLVLEFFVDLSQRRHPTTYGAYRSLLMKAFKELGEPEFMNGVERLKTIKTPAKYFQVSQTERLKKYMIQHDPEMWLFCQFVYYCFLRPRRELRFLKISDIYFDENKILMRGEISKNKKTEFVTIPTAFRPAVWELAGRPSREYVFGGKKPLSYNNPGRRFRKALDILGFGHEYQLYSWKHTGAVAAVKAGVGVKQLQIQLRHHSLEEVDKYIRQLGVNDLQDLEGRFPGI